MPYSSIVDSIKVYNHIVIQYNQLVNLLVDQSVNQSLISTDKFNREMPTICSVTKLSFKRLDCQIISQLLLIFFQITIVVSDQLLAYGSHICQSVMNLFVMNSR